MIVLNGDGNRSVHFEYAGLFQTENEWIHPKRIIDSFELIYITEGTVYLREGDERYILQKDDVYLLTPGLEHGGFQASTGQTSFYWLHFNCPDLGALGLRAGFCGGGGTYNLSLCLRQLLHKTNTFGYPPFTGDFSLGLILSELYFLQNSSSENASKLISDVIEWIRINRERRITVEACARHFNYHPDYLGAVFKKHTGFQLKKYINSERLKYARHIILTTNLTIKQVALSLGWENENQFIHYFTYHEKISPAKMRGLYYNTHLNNK